MSTWEERQEDIAREARSAKRAAHASLTAALSHIEDAILAMNALTHECEYDGDTEGYLSPAERNVGKLEALRLLTVQVKRNIN